MTAEICVQHKDGCCKNFEKLTDALDLDEFEMYDTSLNIFTQVLTSSAFLRYFTTVVMFQAEGFVVTLQMDILATK